MLTVSQIGAALATQTELTRVPDTTTRHAGVAIVLSGPDARPGVCFMQRVERRGDRWSGDVALPGGWGKSHEQNFRDVAARETCEEVGIVLTNAQHLGDVPPINISRNDPRAGTLGASVFYTGESQPALTLDPKEVADAFWVDLHDIYNPANRTVVHWSRSGPPLPRPALSVEGRVIWGLTYRVLVNFSRDVLGAPCPLEPDPG